jgi:hypothetical protein
MLLIRKSANKGFVGDIGKRKRTVGFTGLQSCEAANGSGQFRDVDRVFGLFCSKGFG